MCLESIIPSIQRYKNMIFLLKMALESDRSKWKRGRNDDNIYRIPRKIRIRGENQRNQRGWLGSAISRTSPAMSALSLSIHVKYSVRWTLFTLF